VTFAYFLFTKAILEGNAIDVFNHGRMKRNFTYIDDAVKGIISVIERNAQPNSKWSSDFPDSATSYVPYKIYNISNNNQVELLKFIEIIEIILDKKVNKRMLPMQAGDVQSTYADVNDLMKDTGFRPNTPIE
jgi:UDP-glucuronate 4-epimerase